MEKQKSHIPQQHPPTSCDLTAGWMPAGSRRTRAGRPRSKSLPVAAAVSTVPLCAWEDSQSWEEQEEIADIYWAAKDGGQRRAAGKHSRQFKVAQKRAAAIDKR